MNTYTTRHGREIPKRALREVVRRIRAGDDFQDIITDELREFIPEHDEDLDEATEVFNHCEELETDERVREGRKDWPTGRIAG